MIITGKYGSYEVFYGEVDNYLAIPIIFPLEKQKKVKSFLGFKFYKEVDPEPLWHCYDPKPAAMIDNMHPADMIEWFSNAVKKYEGFCMAWKAYEEHQKDKPITI